MIRKTLFQTTAGVVMSIAIGFETWFNFPFSKDNWRWWSSSKGLDEKILRWNINGLGDSLLNAHHELHMEGEGWGTWSQMYVVNDLARFFPETGLSRPKTEWELSSKPCQERIQKTLSWAWFNRQALLSCQSRHLYQPGHPWIVSPPSCWWFLSHFSLFGQSLQSWRCFLLFQWSQ